MRRMGYASRERERLLLRIKRLRGQVDGKNVTQGAERAGIERESMHRLLKEHGVRSDDFKSKG